jgi:uncharacterized protein YraI
MLNNLRKLSLTWSETIGLALVTAFLFTTGSEASPTLGTRNQVADLEASTISQARYRVVKDVYLNVRDGASVGHQIVGVIPPAATDVTIDDCVREWCHIVWRGVSGWANARFLRPEESTSLPRWLRSTRG